MTAPYVTFLTAALGALLARLVGAPDGVQVAIGLAAIALILVLDEVSP